jgi:beta-glucanase (GH16 family)
MIRDVSCCRGPGARRSPAARVESLESRRLFDAGALFDESFIFGPANAPGAAGYLPDHGAVYADRGNGVDYGWNVDVAGQARLRHSSSIPNEYDGLIAVSPGEFWQVAVPNGSYQVSITLGDWKTTSGLHVVDVDGTIESFKSTRQQWWQEWSVNVNVTDGLLEVSAPLGIKRLKSDEIDSMTVRQQPPAVSANGLAAPSGLTPISQGETSIQLQWVAPAQGVVTGYDIYRGQALVGTVGANATTFTDTGLTAGTSYTYTVTALGAGGSQSLAGNAVTASTQPAEGSPVAPAPAGDWHLSFDDEFDSLNTSVWTNGHYWWDGNGGSQSAFEPANVSDADGILSLTARRQQSTEEDGEVDPYSSGLIQSGGIQGVSSPGFSFTYGYIETRAMFAPGKSMSSTLWMLPVSHQDNQELDLLENYGKSPNVVSGSVHNWPNAGQSVSHRDPSNLDTTWHTYGVDWEPNQITWYVDGKKMGSCSNASLIPQQAMYLIMNLTAGGSFAGAVSARTPAESSWQVDYIRVWQH